MAMGHGPWARGPAPLARAPGLVPPLPMPMQNNVAGGAETNELIPEQPPEDMGHVWYLDKNNTLAMAGLKTGSTDGKMTEVVESRKLKEGMQVIVGTLQTDSENNSNTKSERRMGPPPF